MKLENTFTVPVGADVAWQVLLDVERIAPCMPGASLTGRDGDTFNGKVKVKVGPVSLTYSGTATFSSLDADNHVAVIEAAGRETRGSGTAKAIITARMAEDGGSTKVDVDTDLTITGKPAQFGRGVMAEISGKLITQFADCLAAEITGDGASAESGSADAPQPTEPAPEVVAVNGASADAASSAASASAESSSGAESSAESSSAAPAKPVTPPTLRPVAASPRPTPEAIDLLGTAGLPVLKRVAPALAAVGILLGFVLVRRRRR